MWVSSESWRSVQYRIQSLELAMAHQKEVNANLISEKEAIRKLFIKLCVYLDVDFIAEKTVVQEAKFEKACKVRKGKK